MMRSEPVVDRPHDVAVPVPRQERVARRRRTHSHRRGAREWTVRRSRRRIIRAAVVCAAVLVFMAVALYFGLARQDVQPAEGRRHAPSKKIGKLG